MDTPLTEYQLAILDRLEFVGDGTFAKLHAADYRIGTDDLDALMAHGAICVVRRRNGEPEYGITNTGRDVLSAVGTLPPETEAERRGRRHVEMTVKDFVGRRRVLGISQSMLADYLGVHVRTISKWERGINPIPRHIALALDGLDQQILLDKQPPPRVAERARIVATPP